MSAYMMAWEDFDALGAAAVEYGLAADAEAAARCLYAENRRSVTERYPDLLPWELPGRQAEAGKPYPWQPATVPSAEEVRDLAARCAYQSSECADYRDTEAAALLAGIQAEATARAKAVTAMIPPPPPAVYASAAESAALLRQVLRAAFPGVRFRVTGHRGTAAGSYTVHWEDGPSRDAVEAAARGFEGCRFDWMTDSTEYRKDAWLPDGRRTGIRYLFLERTLSPAYWARLREAVGRALHWAPADWPSVEELQHGGVLLPGQRCADWFLAVREYHDTGAVTLYA